MIGFAIGRILLVEAALLLLPMAVALGYGESPVPYLIPAALLVLCGLVFPVLLSGLSAVIFPSQAKGSLVTADGIAVGAKNVGQDFTDPRFMRCRPSAYQYNTYTVDEEGNKFYNDGSEYAGVASGSNNYGASNPALAERVQGDIDEFLAEHPDLTVEDIPTDLVTASGSGLDPHISPASAAVQIPQLAENTGLTEEQLEQFVADNTTGKVLGIFGEETVNVLGVNLDIAEALGLIGGVD